MFLEEPSQDASMTSVLVFAITTHRKVRRVRQSCENIQQTTRLEIAHNHVFTLPQVIAIGVFSVKFLDPA